MNPQAVDRNFVNLLRAAHQMSYGPGGGLQPHQGASAADIEALPTRSFNSVKTESKAKESLQCMVCLMDYEPNDELRTLPCFHAYHKACIDKWLLENKKCPICKNPIS